MFTTFFLAPYPNCFMLQRRKEKRLLHFKFHAAGAAKGSFRSNVQMSFFVSNVTVIKQ